MAGLARFTLRCRQPSQAQMAAEGGAVRRPAQRSGRADESIARSAPPAAAAPLPQGATLRIGLILTMIGGQAPC
jgi:hypothetical protein